MTNKIFPIAIISIILLGLLVRLIHLNGSFWMDEAAQALESARPFSQQFQIQGDFQPPLYHLLVHFIMLVGKSEWYLRLASLIPGLVTIFMTIRIGEKLFSKHTGLLAGLFLATSQFHAFYSQELRPYSLAAMFGLILIDAYIDLINKHKGFVRFVFSGIAGLYTMYLFPLLLIFIAISTLTINKPLIKKITVALGIIGLSFLPWLPSFLGQLNAGTGLAGSSSVWSQIVSPPLSRMFPLVFSKFFFGRIPFDMNLSNFLIVGVAALICLGVTIHIWNHKNSKLLVMWILLPIIFAFIISIKIPILDPKRVLYCLPPLYILLAQGIGRGSWSVLLTITLLSVNLFAINVYATNPEVQREPWREAITIIEQTASPNAVAVFSFPEPFAPWNWYASPEFKTISIYNPDQNPSQLQQLVAINDQVDQYIVFDYLMDMADPHRKILKTLENLQLEEINFLQYPGIGKIRFIQSGKAYAYGL